MWFYSDLQYWHLDATIFVEERKKDASDLENDTAIAVWFKFPIQFRLKKKYMCY